MIRYFIKFILYLLFFNILISCDSDDIQLSPKFVAAFENPSENFSSFDKTEMDINLVFSEKVAEEGIIEIVFEANELIYEEDFTTSPQPEEGKIRIPIEIGSKETSFTIKKLGVSPSAEEQNVNFSISQIQLTTKNGVIQGNSSTLISFSEAASLGGSLRPNIGGPNEPNQVYVNLSTKEMTEVRRDIWDLGFYSGDDFHVKLNESMYMFAGSFESTNIDEITANDATTLKSAMNFLQEDSNLFVDHPSGNLVEFAIQPISENEEENLVYLIKMGNEISTDIPGEGSVAIAGAERGYKKIRILQQNEGYLLQYADLNATSHQEIFIPKTDSHNFTFFSMETENIVAVEPAKSDWDLNFTVTVEVLELPGTDGQLSAYGYSDYVTNNIYGNVKAYRISTDDFSFSDFSIQDLDESKLESDQRTIGASWRDVPPPMIYNDIFYVIKNSQENFYKLKFTAFQDENGERGHPEFEYKLLY